MPPAPFTVHHLPIPASLDAPEAWALHGVVAVNRAHELQVYGNDDLVDTAAAALASLREQAYTVKDRWVLCYDDDPRTVVASALCWLPGETNAHRADVGVLVHPEHRGRGLGAALHALVEEHAGSRGRTTLITYTDQGVEPEPGDPRALAATTGTGQVDTADPSVRFAVARGYSLEQVERHSRLDLPVDPHWLASATARATAMTGGGYRCHTWTGPCPERWVDQVAVLYTRMSTDIPLGGLDMAEDPWDAARVRVWEDGLAHSGQTALFTVAEHVATGTLAGFTLIVLDQAKPEVAFQEDTLVLADHRGHRLGLLVKVVNLAALTAQHPAVRRVHTWNAQENQHMLAINVAMGYRPHGGAGMWQKRLG